MAESANFDLMIGPEALPSNIIWPPGQPHYRTAHGLRSNLLRPIRK